MTADTKITPEALAAQIDAEGYGIVQQAIALYLTKISTDRLLEAQDGEDDAPTEEGIKEYAADFWSGFVAEDFANEVDALMRPAV